MMYVIYGTINGTYGIKYMSYGNAACYNTAALYDYTYGRTESVPYWQADRQPFSSKQEQNIAWSAITQASKLWSWGKTKWQTKLWTGFAPV